MSTPRQRSSEPSGPDRFFWSNNASPDIRYSLPLLPRKRIWTAACISSPLRSHLTFHTHLVVFFHLSHISSRLIVSVSVSPDVSHKPGCVASRFTHLRPYGPSVSPFHPYRKFQVAHGDYSRPDIPWLYSTSWRLRTWSLNLAKTRVLFLLPNLIVRAHLEDLNMVGTRRYLCFVDLCIMQWRPLVPFGILLAYLLHRRHLHRFPPVQHGPRLHRLSHLHRRRFHNNLLTTPTLHPNDILLPRARRDLCHHLEEALPFMKATPAAPLKYRQWNNGNLMSTSMIPTRSMGWIFLPESAKADSQATKTLKVWILYKSHSGSFCTKDYTTHGSAVLPTAEKPSSFLSTT